MQFGLDVKVLDFLPYRVSGSIPDMGDFWFISEYKVFAAIF